VEPARVGIIGTGSILWAYAEGCRIFEGLEIAACADIDATRAAAAAEQFGIPRACTPDELLADPSIDIVINLTPPTAHAVVSLAAIAAGKHVYSEKPLGVDAAEGRSILEAADAAGVRVGCAPDTFLGAGLQTARRLIDDGAIGTPVAAAAFVGNHGPEAWHPNAEIFYRRGGGPLFDLGPYYLTALVGLLGPVRRVTGSARASFAERTAPDRRIPVTIPTHLAGILDFEAGPIATITASFDVWGTLTPHIEIHGETGSLSLPDPNGFGGPVRLFRPGSDAWEDVPLTHDERPSRGIGVADMAEAIRTGRPHRASGALGQHVLEIAEAIHAASASGAHVQIASTCPRPEPLPAGMLPGISVAEVRT
jgi:predicted dehydrogenase